MSDGSVQAWEMQMREIKKYDKILSKSNKKRELLKNRDLLLLAKYT